MANRDDEYYDRGGRRPSQRDDRYRDDMRSSGRGRDSRPRRDYDDYDERPARRREPEGRGAGYGAPRNGKKNNKALILLVSEIAVALLLLVAAYNIFFKMGATKVGRVNLDESEINDSISDAAADSEHMKGYTNIALFGVDYNVCHKKSPELFIFPNNLARKLIFSERSGYYLKSSLVAEIVGIEGDRSSVRILIILFGLESFAESFGIYHVYLEILYKVKDIGLE